MDQESRRKRAAVGVKGLIRVTGGRVAYRIAGARKKGVPLIVIHGGPGATHEYLEPLEALANERPVVFYDQLGCGDSDKPKNSRLWTIERYARELGELREALKLDRVHILGHSWGTMVAVDYMLTGRPRGVESLVLAAPCLSASRWCADQRAHLRRMPGNFRRIVRRAEAAGEFSSKPYQDAMTQYYKKHVCRLDPWPECVTRSFARLNTEIYGKMWGPSEFSVRGTLKKYERASRLGRLRLPVLFTAGRHDEASPKSAAYYRSKVAGAELAILEGASHAHHLEKPNEFSRRVRAFLRGSESMGRGEAIDPVSRVRRS